MRKYIGIPYKHQGRDKHGLDCWGLILMIYKDKFGLDLPDLQGYSKEWAKEGEDFFRRNYAEQEKLAFKFEQVKTPQKYDMILFYSSKQKLANHAGVYLGDDKFIHCPEVGVIISKLYDQLWKDRVQGFYRLKESDDKS